MALYSFIRAHMLHRKAAEQIIKELISDKMSLFNVKVYIT